MQSCPYHRGLGRRPKFDGSRPAHAGHRFVVHAAKQQSSSKTQQDDNGKQQEAKESPRLAARKRKAMEAKPDQPLLDTFNPVKLGRKARAIYDDVWSQFTKLGAPTSSSKMGNLLAISDTMSEFEAPQAPGTVVLVVGATGRVGRVLLRKLLLRGYKCKAFVRQREGAEERPPGLPTAVEICYGDVGDYASCSLAVRGVDKVVYAAAARSTVQVDLRRVDQAGVANMAKALLDERKRLLDKNRAELALLSGQLAGQMQQPAQGKPSKGQKASGSPATATGAAASSMLNTHEGGGAASSKDASQQLAGHADKAAQKGPSRATTATMQAATGNSARTALKAGKPASSQNGRPAGQQHAGQANKHAQKATGSHATAATQAAAAVSVHKAQQHGLAASSAVVEQLQAQLKEARGLSNNFKSSIADFGKRDCRQDWSVLHIGLPKSDRMRKVLDIGQDRAKIKYPKNDNLRFQGSIYTRGGYAAIGCGLKKWQQAVLRFSEGLVLKVRGDGNFYFCTVTTGDGSQYSARFATTAGYSTVRLPFELFRPRDPSSPPLAAKTSPPVQLDVRYEQRGARAPDVVLPGQELPDDGKDFNLEIDWIRALPSAKEADFILVSCARGSGFESDDFIEDAQRERARNSKQKGEQLLKRSGLGYTVVRPGPLVEEPGGYRALIFDQGNRISQSISCADVADICLKALHNGAAHNKTFEVCYEALPEAGADMFELVAHLPDKSNNYLGPALATLQKNT